MPGRSALAPVSAGPSVQPERGARCHAPHSAPPTSRSSVLGTLIWSQTRGFASVRGSRRMCHFLWNRMACPAVLLLALHPASGSSVERSVTSILERHCVACHGSEIQNASVRLDNLPTDFSGDRRAAETWHDVRDVLNRGEMPPPGATTLPPGERNVLVDWISEQLRNSDPPAAGRDGSTVMRRLNRAEYQNTMRDLLGLDVDYVKNLPPDEVSRDGFTNNGSALRMSALQLEHYLNAARSGLARAIVEGPAPPVFVHRAEATVIDKLRNVHWSNRLGRTGTFVARVLQFPDEGEFILRVKARAEIPAGAPYPRMHVAVGYRADTQTPSRTLAEVDVRGAEVREFEFRGRIEEFPLQSRTQSKYPGLLVWLRNVYTDGLPPPAGQEVSFEENGKTEQKMVWPEDPDFPAIVVESIEFQAPAYPSWPPPHHTRLIPAAPEGRRAERRAAADSVRRLMRRAYRRPVGSADTQPVLRFFDKVRPAVDSFEEAMRETLAMVLVSPDFLYLVERTRNGDRPVSDHELASRLSYFLWSTMPDERLADLADRGRLSDERILRRETVRMLADPRSWAFVEQFSDQWLDLPGVHRIAVNPNYHPDFDLSLKEDMRKETQHFFATLLREDMSAMNFLRSDFSVLNERMARHYGIEGPRGGEFERVSLAGSGRPGGLLTHASILLANSTGEDSHPVERGVWIRSALLGNPPAPPPPAVPNLESGGEDLALLPIRRQLELHRDSEACARCHRGIDPWGVALEEYDALGLRRETVLRRLGDREEVHAVDASAVLPDGREVDGAAALAAYLLESREREFARAIVSKLLSYALGRSLVSRDGEHVDRLVARFREAGYRLGELCTIIVASDAFRRR